MNQAAFEHKAFDTYCYPLDENTLEINLFTGKEVDSVSIVYGDPFSGGIMGGAWSWDGQEKPVTERCELQYKYKWTTTIKPDFKRARYYFKITSQGETLCLLETGIYSLEHCKKYGVSDSFIYPWMNPCDVVKVPQWAKNAVWYQIFPARFSRGECAVNPEKLLPWAPPTQKMEHIRGVKEPEYGGNLQGIIDRLDFLRDLGITAIYMTPINKSSSQHKYDTDDYLEIDPTFGDAETMKNLVSLAHEKGIRVMVDGVFNHCGRFFKPWLDVFNNRENSKYRDWFMINDYNFETPGYGRDSNAAKGKLYTFAFVDFMPKLNTNNPEVRKYLCDVCEKWVKDYDIDGIRLDVANEISHEFCKDLRIRMDSLKEDFYIVGEIWHNSLPWLRGKEFDSVMNYPLQNAIADFCATDKMTSKEFEYAINRCYSMYYRQVNSVLFNQMDSHDTIRILNRCDSNADKARQTLAILFSMPGSVCIYYGTEILLPGGHDPDNRRCMPWKEIESGDYDANISFSKDLIALRKSKTALTSTRIEFVTDSLSELKDLSRVVAYKKISEDDKQTIMVVVNCEAKAVPLKQKGKILLSQNYDDEVLKENGFVFFSIDN